MNAFRALQAKLKEAKSLVFFDLETSPMLAYVWSTGKQFVTHQQLETQTKIISAQWMFEGDKEVSYEAWDSNQDDTRVVLAISEVLKYAKVAVSQNGRQFDHKILRWRANILGLPPIREVEIFDTLSLSRKAFRPASHKLDYRSAAYGLGGKIHMELKDWIDVLKKKPGSLEKMVKYGCKDILDLRRLFWKELPYYQTLPSSLAKLVYPFLGNSREFCSKCASKKQRKFDIYPTKIDNKAMMKCEHCGYFWKETRVLK